MQGDAAHDCFGFHNLVVKFSPRKIWAHLASGRVGLDVLCTPSTSAPFASSCEMTGNSTPLDPSALGTNSTALLLRAAEERARGIAYDAVLLSRWDVLWQRPLLPAELPQWFVSKLHVVPRRSSPEVGENARHAQASEHKPGRAERGQPSNVFGYEYKGPSTSKRPRLTSVRLTSGAWPVRAVKLRRRLN